MIRVGIYGYGNLGRGIEAAIKKNKDMELLYVFTRRNPSDLVVNTKGCSVVSAKDVLDYKDKIDILAIAGGSATDLPEMTPALAKHFNVIDSFDTHANIKMHYDNVNKAAKETNHAAFISCGWDPGMFSLNRCIMQAILPDGKDYTFWGKGVSQGHSDAIRRIEGVIDARQYTIPIDEALEAVRSGSNPELTTRQKHRRECYVVAKDPKDYDRIEKEIKEMPNYFSDYDTTVHFITLEELKKNHNGIPHGGFVIRSGSTSDGCNHVVEYSLKLDSNPEFTGSVIVAYIRALYRMAKRGEVGCFTVFDVCPKDIQTASYDELLAHTL